MAPLSWYLRSVVLAAASITVGLVWDISWHMSIGRDTFWSPPHMAIYLGAIVAGLASGWVIFRTTFAGGAAERSAGVRVWGLRGPLGAFYCSWGAGAMLTSAPFDDWWHNAYGLDVKILSPPHVVLGFGIIAIHMGAMLTALVEQNRSEAAPDADGDLHRRRRAWRRFAFAFSSGLFLSIVGLFIYEDTIRVFMHSSICYQVACGLFPSLLAATARGSRLRWPATTAAAIYTALGLAMLWILPLFPAEPKLGPVLQPITHLVPLEFPLLLLPPAFAIDLLMRLEARLSEWRLAAALGLGFLVVFLAVQWPWADFLMSPASRNWIFATNAFPYYRSPHSNGARYLFARWDGGPLALARGLAWAAVFSIVSARLGLMRGAWMRRVQR